MFSQKRYRHENKEGIVVVSISNLFHILDLSRTKEQEENKIHKSNTRSLFFFNLGLNKEKDKDKEKENNLIKREISKDIEADTKSKDKDDENKEIKGSIIEKDIKPKTNISDKKDNVEKDVRHNLAKESAKNMPKTYKRIQANKNVIKKEKSSYCDYFFNLVLCIFLLLIFNNCYIWIFSYMFSEQKNKSYCFDLNIKEFRICIESEYCPSSGNHDFIYINDESISNKNVKKEIQNINSKYLNFFMHESIMFSNLNKKFIKSERTLSKYSVTIISSKNEKYLFNNSFRVGCESYFLELLLIIAFAFIAGNIIFGLLADIWGRKRILILVVFIEIAGGFILFLSSFFIQRLRNIEKTSEKFSVDLLTKYISDIDVNSSLLDIYTENFYNIKQEVYESLLIKHRFQKYKTFVFIGIFLIFISNSSIKTISLSYLLENALTEKAMSQYFLLFILSTPLSILLSSCLVIYMNSFHFPILLLAIAQLVIIILIIIFFYESQRFNFEYCFYSRITEFTEYILGKEELRINYRVKDDEKNTVDMSSTIEKENINFFGIYYSLDDYRIQTELNNEKINENTYYLDSIKFPRNYLYKFLYYNNYIQKPTFKNIIERFNIYRNPFYLFKLMKKDKQLKKKSAIIFSFIISLSIVINLSLQRVTTIYLVQREKLISSTVFGSYLFLFICLTFIILFPFVHYLVKCFGIYIILFPSLVLITISSALFEIICFFNLDSEFTDLTKYHQENDDKIVDSASKYLLPFVYIISFSFVELDYVLYFFILKLTKTIYRCSFLAKCQIIYDICFFISFGLEKYISGGYYYACIFSIISIVNSVFVNTSEDSLNIGEMREIKFDETKNNEKK